MLYFPEATVGEWALHWARRTFPGLPQPQLMYILWNETGYPCFFDGDPEQTLCKQLRNAKRRMKYAQNKRKE